MTGGSRIDAGVVAALEELHEALERASFPLATPGAAAAQAGRQSLLAQLDDYVLPRLRALDAPLLAVVGGSTGAGKSTLVNSLVGEQVTTSGVLRPTTRAPVLICAPADRPWFEGDRVLPGLARVTGAGGPGTLQLVPTDALPPGLALLDAPDIDSVVSANRELAAQLLAAADLWLFVTTAARYADAVPWELLRTARERSTAIAVVLDRVPPEAVIEITGDLVEMLRREGLEGVDVHPVTETTLVGGLLPSAEVGGLRAWLHELAADAGARSTVVRRTLEGALASLDARLGELAEQESAQHETARALRSAARAPYVGARGEVDEAVRGGTLLRGEVLARWQEFVGTGELMRTVQARVGELRDRLRSALTGNPTPAAGLRDAVESGVESLVRAAADGAAESAAGRWSQSPAGRALLAGDERELSRASAGLSARLPVEVREWQGRVLDLVAREGASKRSTARVASYTVNGAGLAVMIAVFASTGGLTGAEVAVAGGTSAAGQKLLEAIFGDQAVRSLAKLARDDLLERVDVLLDGEAERFTGRLDALGLGEQSTAVLAPARQQWRAAYRPGSVR